MMRHFETSVAKRSFLRYSTPHCELQQKMTVWLFVNVRNSADFCSNQRDYSILTQVKHPGGLSRVKADVVFFRRDKQTGWRKNHGDNKRRNRGRSSSRTPEAAFFPSPMHTQPKIFENGKCFFWDRRLVITPQGTKPNIRRPALGNQVWLGR